MAECYRRLWLIHSQGALIVLLWTILVHQLTIYSSGYLFLYQIEQNGGNVFLFGIALNIVQTIGFLLYPITGLLADIYWTRFKTMYIGLWLQLCGVLLVTIVSFVSQFHPQYLIQWSVWLLLLLPLGVVQFGVGLFASNAVQFATDQMPTASSNEMSAFVYWYFWAIFMGHGENSILLLVLTSFTSFDHALEITLLCVCLLQCVCLCSGIVVIWFLRERLINEPAGRNPLKTLVGVLKYAWKHKIPQFRSAFTYGAENPSRLDFAKSRFGGPFTTEEVEDVKTVFRILLVMLGTVGFWFTNETISTSVHLQKLANALNITSDKPFQYITSTPFGGSTFVILTFIPLYQFFFRPYLHRYLPTMLKRMFYGLLCSLLAVIVLQIMNIVLSYRITCNQCTVLITDTCVQNQSDVFQNQSDSSLPIPYQLILLPQIFNGISFLFVFLTAIEFILAQAPRLMQVCLIGIWYSMQSIKLLTDIIETIPVVDCQVYLTGIKAVIIIILLPSFIIIAIKYKRREREEHTNINTQNVIEETFFRRLQREELDNFVLENISVDIEDNNKYGTVKL